MDTGISKYGGSNLTAPWDKTQDDNATSLKQITLSETEVSNALECNYKSVSDAFPKIDKLYADPTIPHQIYGLHSFVPAKGAVPDEHGVFGFIKFRGAFQTIEEADERAEFLVRHSDSYNEIYTSYVGRPFPVANKKEWAAQTKYVDPKEKASIMKKKVEEYTKTDTKKKIEEEKRIVEEINEREKKLLADSAGELCETAEEKYISLHVKRANLTHVYITTMKKLADIKNIIIKTRKEISDMESADPSVKDGYIERYMQARKEVGISEPKTDAESFVKYMGLDDTEALGF